MLSRPALALSSDCCLLFLARLAKGPRALPVRRQDEASQNMISLLWDEAFEEGRLAALDELQDRFCVCMK